MEDKSIFQGWVETSHHRFEEKGNDIWGAYEKQASPLGDSFIFVGYIKCGSDDPQKLTDTFNWHYSDEPQSTEY